MDSCYTQVLVDHGESRWRSFAAKDIQLQLLQQDLINLHKSSYDINDTINGQITLPLPLNPPQVLQTTKYVICRIRGAPHCLPLDVIITDGDNLFERMSVSTSPQLMKLTL